jgi:hypothetical protein
MVLETTQETRGVARINAGFGNVPGHHCTGPNDHMVADRHREDGRIGAHTDVTANFCGPPKLPFPLARTANREEIVDEHRAVRNEAIVANRHHIANEGVGLDPAAFSHHGSALDFNKRADEAVVAYDATIEINGLNDGDLFAERDVHHPGMLDFWFSHKLLIRPVQRHRSRRAFQYRNHVPSVLDAAPGNALATNAIQVVFRPGPKRFDKLDLRQKYIPAAVVEFRVPWLVKIHVLTQASSISPNQLV